MIIYVKIREFSKKYHLQDTSTTMTTIPKKKANGKGVDTAAEAEVATLLMDAGLALTAPSPFAAGGSLTFPPSPPVVGQHLPPSSSSSLAVSTVAQRADEMNMLKRKLAQLEDQARTAFVAPAAVVAPSPSLAAPNAEILGFFKSMEAIRAKEAAEATTAYALARKEDFKSYEALSKKLSKKDDKAKYNLKQTTILVDTGDALRALSEGCYMIIIIYNHC